MSADVVEIKGRRIALAAKPNRTLSAEQVLREATRLFASYLTAQLPNVPLDDPLRDEVAALIVDYNRVGRA